MKASSREDQLTRNAGGHILTNAGVWSPDSCWLVYDTRSDAAGEVFDGTRIEMVNIHTGEIRVLYESQGGAHCGVATFSPTEHKVVFILGPENPSTDWQYGPSRRQGVLVDVTNPGVARNVDARDLIPPFTPGALRGGSHVHVFDGDGEWISFTYEDQHLSGCSDETPGCDMNLRNVGVSVPCGAVHVPRQHPRNHDGEYFSVVVTRTTAHPRPGSDEIRRAFEDAWVGTRGYVRQDGSRQRRAIAFQGHVVTTRGEIISEVFIADLPGDVTVPGEGPLQGTPTRRPFPPRGVNQRRLTFTADREHPGLQGPRHWLRSCADGSRLGFLMKDAKGIVQFWTVSPNGGNPMQVTRNPWPVTSAFTWHPDGRQVAFVMDRTVCVTDVVTGETRRITSAVDEPAGPRPEACVFSPDGNRIAYVRRVSDGAMAWNQIFVTTVG